MARKTVFVCSECGRTSPKWQGQCPGCGSWNSFVEEAEEKKTAKTVQQGQRAVRFSEMERRDNERLTTGIGELDRVLGGGLVKGSVVLLAGEPGIGKSTLLLQLCGKAAGKGRILYVSGEESKNQLALRADRLGVSPDELFVLTETSVESVLDE